MPAGPPTSGLCGARQWALYFFSKSSVAPLRNSGRRRLAAFANSQGNDTSMQLDSRSRIYRLKPEAIAMLRTCLAETDALRARQLAALKPHLRAAGDVRTGG